MADGFRALESFGFTWPTPAYIVGVVLFGLLGMMAYYVGKRRQRQATKWLGVALMLYPYVVSETWLLYTVGAALCLGIWLDRGS
ncbi:MAG: hypothetical protein ABI641_15820 [Caldimonas sp.]